MAFPGQTYAPPGVYTQTNFDNPLAGQIELLKIPLFMGEGSELIPQQNLEVIRGSSSSVDQQVYLEDETGRGVASVLDDGSIVHGAFDGELTKLQVRNFPIVNGRGSGTTSNDRSAVEVRINSKPVVVRSIVGSTGVIELAQAPKEGDLVQVTYFFNRTDTLITDTLSSQVTEEDAVITAYLGLKDVSLGGSDVYSIVEDGNDTLILTVDGALYTISIPEIGSGYTVQNMITLINSATTSSLVASSVINNQGKKAIRLTADQEIKIGLGNANSTLGLVGGEETARTKIFYTHQGPIVDGSNGGVTTTATKDVTVLVDGVQVIPVSVNGQTRAIELPMAPKKESSILVTYYFNTWQDTFDYLANINISEITQCGRTANQNDFIDGADFILREDKVVWGTSALASSGVQSAGSIAFDDSQISLLLVDNQMFMAECSSVTDTSGTTAVTSTTKFKLPLQPTSGNGRNSPLGSSLFQTVTNGRIDLPTNRPDLVTAYWGFDVQDALDRGAVSVLSVDSSTSTIELAEQVPVGAKVFATFYYNTLTDSEYILSNITEGASGVGEYSVTKNGVDFYNTSFDVGSKSASLSTITLQFPSGSELTPDSRIEGGTPVEETVTVKFASTQESPAKFVVANASPYYFVEGASHNAQIKVDGGSSIVVDLTDAHGKSFGHFASLIGAEIVYDADSGSTTVDIDSTNRDLAINIDGVILNACVGEGAQTVKAVAIALNEVSVGANHTLSAGTTIGTLDVSGGTPTLKEGYYIGWKAVILSAVSGATVGAIMDITADDGAGLLTTDSTETIVATDDVYLYNPNALPKFKGSSQFLGTMELGGTNGYTDIQFDYQGDVSGASTVAIVIATVTYASATEIADAINLQLVSATNFCTETSASDFTRPMITAFADSNGRIGFTFRKATADSSGVFALQANTTPHDDFCLIAGLDATTTGYGGASAHILHGDVATHYIAGTGKFLFDRVILRNRISCGGGSENTASSSTTSPHNALSQCKLEVLSGTANDLFGLSVGDYGLASSGSVINPASIVGDIGNATQITSGGGDTQGEASVTFYDGTGVKAQNNIFTFTIDGMFLEVAFSASASGTVAPIGSGNTHGTQDSSSIIYQIKNALSNEYFSVFGSTSGATLMKVVRREGFGVRLTALKTDSKSKITIGDGSANTVLGFADGAVALLAPTTAHEVASVLMNDVAVGSFGDVFFGASANYQTNGVSTTSGDFPNSAIAYVVEDDSGQDYLAIQSKSVGISSSIVMEDASSNSWLNYGTLIGASDGDSSIGEASTNGFFVFSNNSKGSGSADDSVFNNGGGSDGIVGKTYVDSITGLTFTVLPREGGGVYPDDATFQFEVSKTYTVDANNPVLINGVEMTVSNTIGIAVGDTAVVETFEKGGEQPEIGEPYVVSYLYRKESFETQLYTKMSAIEKNMGEISPENPLALASYLAILNGSVLVALKQVMKAEGESQGSTDAYLEALDSVEGKIAGQILPDIIVPLRTDSSDFIQLISRHVNIQSSIRYRSERTAVVGASAGTDVKSVITLAKSLKNTRMRLVYPDTALVPITDVDGNVREYLVDGVYPASALVGNRVSPTRDVATPWTNAQLVGFSKLGRILDAVEMNQVSVNGVTVLENNIPFLRVRHGLTTDMSKTLTKVPTIIQIADEVHLQSRNVLASFNGLKFLPSVLPQIEGRMSKMYISLVKGQIVVAYTGINAQVSADDNTVAEIESFYAPIFPLLYLVATFNVRSRLSN